MQSSAEFIPVPNRVRLQVLQFHQLPPVFTNYFQALYKVGQFEQLLHFTAHESIQRYGTKSLLEKYHQMQFAYPLKLKSMTKEGGYTILNYETQKLATKRMLRLKVVIENDTTKLVIDENFLKEIGR